MLWLHQVPHTMVTILYPMSLSMWVTSMVRINQSILIIFASLFTLSILLTVRNMLIVFALFSLIMALINFVTSVLLCVALRKVSSMFSHPFNKHISLSFHSCPKARETWSTETHAVQKGNIDALMPSTNSRNPI